MYRKYAVACRSCIGEVTWCVLRQDCFPGPVLMQAFNMVSASLSSELILYILKIQKNVHPTWRLSILLWTYLEMDIKEFYKYMVLFCIYIQLHSLQKFQIYS